MSSNELVEQIMAQVIARVATPEQTVTPDTPQTKRETAMAGKCSLTEFVGTAIGDTVGLVIANVDSALLDAMKLEKRYRSIGILGARVGAGPHIMAADEAVKATNTEVISIELPRDTKGGAGHGSLILLGGNDVSDVKRGIEVALKELDRTFGDVYA
ncbi:propanediol utilization microcompartment protein PduB, partial [Escherichia coli]|nr:propanediol utilization microcompartment protein PduB [Escherichia coli]